MALHARLLPGGNSSDADVAVTVYIVTGWHGLFWIPESFCEECHLFVQTARAAAEEVEADVSVDVVSWWTHIVPALLLGGYHPPVLAVEGTRVAQGEDVPSKEAVVEAIQDAMA